jgi:dolichol-phosphate mannosyltransferase
MSLENSTPSGPELSVVVPLFNEQENLPELYGRVTRFLESRPISFEVVLVNDGSSDATAAIMEQLEASDERVRGIHLSRNFGHQAALSAGLDHARGRAVVVMDGDLQDPPELIEQFLEKWRAGYEVVYAVRARRQEHVWKRAGYALFYRLLRATSDLNIPLDSGDFCLLDRKVVAAIQHMPERLRFVRGLRAFVGFRQVGVSYDRPAREAGRTKYTWRSLTRLALDGLFGFSRLPLAIITCLGLLLGSTALLLTWWILWRWWSEKATPGGWSITMVAVLFCSAVQLAGLGILGEYIRRIFVEVKGRPTYLVRPPSSTVRRRRKGKPLLRRGILPTSTAEQARHD